jgi:hypothetical protein
LSSPTLAPVTEYDYAEMTKAIAHLRAVADVHQERLQAQAAGSSYAVAFSRNLGRALNSAQRAAKRITEELRGGWV